MLSRAANHRMHRRTGGQFSRMDAQLPVPADPGRSPDEKLRGRFGACKCCAVELLRGHSEPRIHTNEHGCAARESAFIGVYLWLLHCLSRRPVEPLDRTCTVIRVNLRPFVVQTVCSRAPRGRLSPPSTLRLTISPDKQCRGTIGCTTARVVRNLAITTSFARAR